MFKSAFLSDELKHMVDHATNQNLSHVKEKLISAMKESKKFNSIEHFMKVQRTKTSIQLQQLFYSYLLAAEDNKVIK